MQAMYTKWTRRAVPRRVKPQRCSTCGRYSFFWEELAYHISVQGSRMVHAEAPIACWKCLE